MRELEVYRNGIFAGTLTELNRQHYVFRYDDRYFPDSNQPAISLTLPKSHQEYNSKTLFSFFSNLLAEGENRKLQSRLLKIDESDEFGLLMKTATTDTIGSITVKVKSEK